VTAEEMAVCAAQGQFWFMRPDGTFYGSDVREQPDVYLLNASPEWVAQWDDWADAVEAMEPMFKQFKQDQGDGTHG
jgi:hypothetical protein